MADVQQPLPSPGVGARRKVPKTHPKLPLSVFTPPSTGTSDRFPLPPSPSAVHPSKITDAHVVDLDTWRADAENAFGAKIDGAVLAVSDIETAKRLTDDVSLLAISVPLPLGSIASENLPESTRIHFSATIDKKPHALVESVRWAISHGRVVDLHCDLGQASVGWDLLEDLIVNALDAQEGSKGKLILSNILPPPQSLELPIVKLLTDPTYISYQSYIASLSLNSNVLLKFLPPAWGEPTPEASLNDLSKEAREWKRRVKMYLGPAVEAFGYQRIIFGSSPSPAAQTTSTLGYWYEIARESFAELGLEQEDIDAVFSKNAKGVYSS